MEDEAEQAIGIEVRNLYRSATIYGCGWTLSVSVSAFDKDALVRAIATARRFFDDQEAAADIRVEWRIPDEETT